MKIPTVVADMKLIFLLPLSILLACSSSQNINTIEPEILEEETSEVIEEDDVPVVLIPDEIPAHNIEITISHFAPYCGGAHPSEEILENQYRLMGNTEFILLNLETMDKERVQTNAKGVLYLQLPKGRYAIRELFKDCSYSEFVERNPAKYGGYLVPSPDTDCYKNWWLSNLGEFEISDPAQLQSFTYETGDRCFTGSNPCVEYIGPYPP